MKENDLRQKKCLHTIASLGLNMLFVTGMHGFKTLTLGKEHTHKSLSFSQTVQLEPWLGRISDRK